MRWVTFTSPLMTSIRSWCSGALASSSASCLMGGASNRSNCSRAERWVGVCPVNKLFYSKHIHARAGSIITWLQTLTMTNMSRALPRGAGWSGISFTW